MATFSNRTETVSFSGKDSQARYSQYIGILSSSGGREKEGPNMQLVQYSVRNLPPVSFFEARLGCALHGGVRSKLIDLQPAERENRDLIGAVSRCVHPPGRTSKLPQNHFQRSLTS